MKNVSLEQIENDIKLYEEILDGYKDWRDDVLAKQQLPGLVKKYKDTYWKYRNGYNDKTKWWLYSYCKDVVDVDRGLFDSFQTMPQEREFKIGEESSFHLCEVKITRGEYMRELNKFLKAANLLKA